MKQINKARKLKSIRVDFKFPNLGNPFKLKVISYSDATYASPADGSSQGAFIVLLKHDNNCVDPISWQSKKLNREIKKSPLASETLASNEGTDAGFLAAVLVQGIFKLSFLPSVEYYTEHICRQYWTVQSSTGTQTMFKF